MVRIVPGRPWSQIADLMRRLGRRDEAREAYLAATAATQLEPLRRLYARRLRELDQAPASKR